MRYGERIKVSYFVAPDCMDVRIPKLILQPFMENAFFHAFNDKPDGYIYVLVSTETGALLCEIVDNGSGIEGLSDKGMLPAPKGGRQLFSGIGIRNAVWRCLRRVDRQQAWRRNEGQNPYAAVAACSRANQPNKSTKS
jgi:sensor histidine kinase YesM